MLGTAEIRPAARTDLDQVVSILTEAATWARDAGVVGLWSVPYPAEWVAPAIERGEVHLVLVDGTPLGTISFQWEDVPIWGVRPPDAGYVHRIATRRDPRASGLGRWMIDWAGARVAEARRNWLRLDTRSTHAGLRRYYLRQGFRIVGMSETRGLEVVLLERPAAGTPAPSGRPGS